MINVEFRNGFVIRNGEIEHVWRFRASLHGFESFLLIEGTESEVRAYIESEFPEFAEKAWYSACTEAELKAAKAFGMKIYIAPQDI